jgi:hypothetical protein
VISFIGLDEESNTEELDDEDLAPMVAVTTTSRRPDSSTLGREALHDAPGTQSDRAMRSSRKEQVVGS